MPHAVARRWPRSPRRSSSSVSLPSPRRDILLHRTSKLWERGASHWGNGQDPVHAISEGHDQTSRVKGSKDTLSRYTWGGASLHCTDRASPRQQMHWYQKAGYLDGQGTTGVFDRRGSSREESQQPATKTTTVHALSRRTS
ncbi:Os07g0550200 [Oryza sativa Japonica Group]|uniref:Os07g0550200 protein n=1 Tax=Oryza sativa subsp. japonica TaxID=39947 RepID=A0A0P0X757_ORYSJ|nr:Os07g0550200 [Oryza sativa Japonica Group]